MVDTKVQAHPTDDKNPLFEGDLNLRDGNLMLDSCRLIFERSHSERSENEFFRSRFSDLLELNSCAKLQN